jgi:tetratricopeptide (TPR) repeat protein
VCLLSVYNAQLWFRLTAFQHCILDFPGNFEASFALAAFHLRTVISNATEKTQIKKTTAMLLKAAKLDPTKSGPFSLLGTCYELQKDMSRAKGCYQKALTIDPSHPVAGRGLLRLIRLDEAQSLCENAVKRNSPASGWAWRALGQLKSMEDGDFTIAATCYQQALRCRDIQAPENDMLRIFFANPTSPAETTAQCEACETWVELAACYRRLGKYSAALRAFEEAFFVSGGVLSPDALCAWAQIHLDLGMYDEAAYKCAKILSVDTPLHFRRMAAYIKGESCLFLARSCIQEGKFGSSLAQLQKGIASVLSIKQESIKSHYCEVKLLGDLYSSGNLLPSYVFDSNSPDDQHPDNIGRLKNEVQNQLLFLINGEHAYTLAIELAKEEDESDRDNNELIAAAAIDLATNILFQARVLLSTLGESSGRGGGSNSFSVNDLIARSVNAYLFAVDICPHEASAWCGLGCALIAVDPTMSQHAFCRALQIDSSLADSWSNVGLMYASHDAEKCSEILDHLAQVDDTPLMWIGRGLLFEKASREWKRQDVARGACFTKAADAYRAALQVSQHPAALLGLSLTCRKAIDKSNDLVYTDLANKATKFESRVSMVIHQNITGEGNVGACYVSGLTQIEEGLNAHKNKDYAKSEALITEAKKSLNDVLIRSEDVGASLRHEDPTLVQCEIDLSVNVSSRPQKTEEFPCDMINRALNFELAPSSLNSIIDRDSNNGIRDARNGVLLNPDSGEAWLIFAHLLVQEATVECRCTRSLTSAKIAAERAFELLHERVVYAKLTAPQRQDHQGLSIEYSETNALLSLPPATLLSQSIALLSWLGENETQESGGNPHIADRTFSSLQEALMLDPLNSLAAAKLSQFN